MFCFYILFNAALLVFDVPGLHMYSEICALLNFADKCLLISLSLSLSFYVTQSLSLSSEFRHHLLSLMAYGPFSLSRAARKRPSANMGSGGVPLMVKLSHIKVNEIQSCKLEHNCKPEK